MAFLEIYELDDWNHALTSTIALRRRVGAAVAAVGRLAEEHLLDSTVTGPHGSLDEVLVGMSTGADSSLHVRCAVPETLLEVHPADSAGSSTANAILYRVSGYIGRVRSAHLKVWRLRC